MTSDGRSPLRLFMKKQTNPPYKGEITFTVRLSGLRPIYHNLETLNTVSSMVESGDRLQGFESTPYRLLSVGSSRTNQPFFFP